MTPYPQTRWIVFSERVYRALLHLYPADYRQEYGALMAQLFVGLGCVGLALREGQPTGARRALQLTALGALVLASGMLASLFQNELWTLWLAGALAHLGGLLTLGILHARQAVLPCFRWLPLQMALGWLIVGAGVLRFGSITANNLLGFLMFAGMGLAWVAIGQALQRQRQAAQPAAA